MILEKAIIPPLNNATRLSDLKIRLFNSIQSRAGLKKALDKNRVYLNGKRAGTADLVSGGETLELLLAEAVKLKKPEIEINIPVLFEDEYLAIVEKPAGILVSGNKKWTLENALPGNLKLSTQPDALSRPQPVHRLDYPTSGCLLIGKTTSTVLALNQLFFERCIEKGYHAICIGRMLDNGNIDSSIDEKQAISHYKVLARIDSPRFDQLNLVDLKLETGRRHQLRKHLSSIGNPILGDHQYGIEGLILKGKGLYLHASTLKFNHPIDDKKLTVSSNLPKKYLKLFPDYHSTLSPN